MPDSTIERSEKDGLVVIIDDEANLLTFEWDDETHPQWNFLHDLGEEGVTEMLLAHCNQVLSENETKDLHNPGPSS
tara:strand:- start:130 stop:357 length:228 start_codon:yes stop_codon:yes gene_type:complete